MMINLILNFLAVMTLGIIQVSFLTTWPWPVSSLNLILSLVIFLAIIVNYQKGLWFAWGAGLFLELFSNLPFGLLTLSLILTVVGINFLFTNFFTNRSLYSLIILGVIATLGYNLILFIFTLLLITIGLPISLVGFDFWSEFFWQPFFNLLILIIIFFTYYFSTGRLRNIFLLPNEASTPHLFY